MRSSLLGIIALVVPIMLLTGLSVISPRVAPNMQTAPTPTVWPFDPALYDVPTEIGGYKVVAVISAENTMCTPPNLLTLVVRAESPSPQTYLASDEPLNLNAAISELLHPGWTWSIMTIGPPVPLDNWEAETEKWNEVMRKNGCEKLGRVIVIEETPTPLP